MRGVGQTQNLIDNLPYERCIVVSPNSSLSREIKKRVEDIRGKDASRKIKFVCISTFSDISKIMGVSCPVFFDHSFFDEIKEDVVKATLESAHIASITYQIGKSK